MSADSAPPPTCGCTSGVRWTPPPPPTGAPSGAVEAGTGSAGRRITARLADTQTDALWRLSREEEMTARRLADQLQVDASTATSMIDRLERLGLVRRIPHLSDRRVKVIQLTAEGCALRDRVIRHTAEHSPFARLDREGKVRLHELLRAAVDGGAPAAGSGQIPEGGREIRRGHKREER
ncbi:MarR family transcriptional regulator [Actinomadura sp. NPDC000600]|uniref:MarR family winged helix-turn-helix transcriptional regulator n=1 Tax=Actinomadura sp. NPDC000600 TaxID=3154262 RepID=UPI00339AF609